MLEKVDQKTEINILIIQKKLIEKKYKIKRKFNLQLKKYILLIIINTFIRNKIMKCRSNFNYSKIKKLILSISYNCYDSYCNTWANASVKYIKIKGIETPLIIDFFKK